MLFSEAGGKINICGDEEMIFSIVVEKKCQAGMLDLP